MIKDKNYYLNLDYDIIISKISKEDGGGYFAYYKDYSGVMGDGNTKQEAIKDVKDAFSAFVEVAILNKDPIKEPNTYYKSKRINITMPQNILEKLDNYLQKKHLSRSSFFKNLALKELHLSW